MISGILAGGIPGFRIELCCFLHPSSGPWFFVVFSLLSCIMGLRNMTHKLSSACAEMILSYHLLPQQIFFTHNWNLTRHFRVVVCFLVCLLVCVLCGLFLLVLVFLCCFCFWFFVFRFCSFERDQGIGLCIGPYQLPVAALQLGPCAN